jgi:hypothetical protein
LWRGCRLLVLGWLLRRRVLTRLLRVALLWRGLLLHVLRRALLRRSLVMRGWLLISLRGVGRLLSRHLVFLALVAVPLRVLLDIVHLVSARRARAHVNT